MLHVYVDGVCVSAAMRGYLVRRAPGHAHYDYGQMLTFELGPHRGELTTVADSETSSMQADPLLPRGCIQLYT